MIKQAQKTASLVRYGRIPEIARFEAPEDLTLERGCSVVVETHRGVQLGEYLESVTVEADVDRPTIVRVANGADQQQFKQLASRCDGEFDAWVQRIEKWDLDLQLLDLELTLDAEKLILYVLNERGPDCTKLALQAAAGGFGIIEVQPVDGNGIVEMPNAAGGG